jgi:GMP synthase (glutamine-hydrolysing)
MSHGDKIAEMLQGFTALAHTENSLCRHRQRKNMYGLQFTEVVHTPEGKTMLHNFVYHLRLQEPLDDGPSSTKVSPALKSRWATDVLSALSGGVDSSVAATLVHRAIGDNYLHLRK